MVWITIGFEVVRKGLALAASNFNFNINTIVGKGISCPGCKTSALIPEPGRFWDNNNIFYTVNTEFKLMQDLNQSSKVNINNTVYTMLRM